MFSPCLVFAAILAAAAAPCAAIAAQKSGNLPAQAAFSAPVPNGGERTFADLTALVFPGIKSQREIRRAAEAASPEIVFSEPVYLLDRRIGEKIAPLRPLAERFKMQEPPPPRYYLDSVSYLRVKGDGKPLLAALFGGGNGAGSAALALFEEEPQGRLLDLVHVRSDDVTEFVQVAALPLGTAASAFVLRNTHDGHTVGYEEDTLVFVQDGRFAEIGGFSINWSKLGCSDELQETARFRVRPDNNRRRPRIEAVVTTRMTTRPENCEQRRTKATVTTSVGIGAWRWAAALQSYQAQPSALGALGADREK